MLLDLKVIFAVNKSPMPSPPRAWAEVNLSALDHNLALARNHSGKAVMAVLKAGAYGHGLVELGRHLDTLGLPFFGVANVKEARTLREAGIQTQSYLLGATFPDEREEVLLEGWVPCLSSVTEIEDFSRLCTLHQRKLQAHLAVDTGMGRGGFLPEEIPQAIAVLEQPAHQLIELTGLGSHLPSADEDPTFTRQQFAVFEELTAHFSERSPFHLHLSNSAGLLDYQSSLTTLVRPGLMLYGVSPLPHWQEKLRPVMTLKSRVSLIRTLPAGHGVSYGRTTILEKETRVATIGIGYGDGLPRAISGKGAHVLINGEKAPLLGRVTMDQIMVDVSQLPHCAVGDEVELFGPHLLVTQVAQWAGTIAWEVLTGITPRVTRIYSPQD